MGNNPTKHRLGEWLDASPWRPPALLLLLTIAVWGRTVTLGLHYWDDDVYFLGDPRLQALSLPNLWAILTEPFFANYHPLTTLTFLWDRLIWNTSSWGFHVTHLVLYSVGVLLVHRLFEKLLNDRFWALVGAAVFCVHTLHVEVIAWLACRKDVVCLVTFTAALIAYLNYRQMQTWRSYITVLLWTALALLSKGYAAVLPMIFLAWDLCYLERIERRHLVDKIPLFVLSLLLTVATVAAQNASQALLHDSPLVEGLTPWVRTVTLLKIFAVYVGRTVFPLWLNAKYIVGTQWLNPSVALLGFALLGACGIGIGKLRRSHPTAAFSLALFLLPLATTMNTFFTLRIWMADRYLLLPTLGACLLLAETARRAYARPKRRHEVRKIQAFAVAVVAFYSSLSWSRTEVWKSPVALRSDSLRKSFSFLDGSGPVTAEEFVRKSRGLALPSAVLEELEDLSAAYRREGRTEEATRLASLLNQLGRGGLEVAATEADKGNWDEAIRLYSAEVEKGEWTAADAARSLAEVYGRKGDLSRAREWFAKARQWYERQGRSAKDPLVGEMALEFNSGNLTRALEILKEIQRLDPSDPRGPFFEARALEEMGDPARAYVLYEKVERMPASSFSEATLKPSQLHVQMGITAQKLARLSEARRHFEEALRLEPSHPQREAIEQTLQQLPQAAQ